MNKITREYRNYNVSLFCISVSMSEDDLLHISFRFGYMIYYEIWSDKLHADFWNDINE